MACGVPVVAYNRGGPGEIVQDGITGFVVEPDNLEALTDAALKVKEIDRLECRKWVERFASKEVFATQVEEWIKAGLSKRDALPPWL